MQLSVHDTTGAVVGKAQASDVVFGAPENQDLLHQALVYYQANQRQGNSSTLTRGNVSGGGRKPFAQKGTGRARQGSIRSPLQRHGGVVFGPHPRSYRQRMPKRMRRKAIRTALSGKVAAERVIVLKGLESIEHKTKAMAGVLGALGVKGSVLVVLREPQPELARTVRNLPRTKALSADLLNVLDLLRYESVIMTTEAVERVDQLWSDTARLRSKPLPVPEPAPKRTATRRTAATRPAAEAAPVETPAEASAAEPTPEAPAAEAPKPRAPRRTAATKPAPKAASEAPKPRAPRRAAAPKPAPKAASEAPKPRAPRRTAAPKPAAEAPKEEGE